MIGGLWFALFLERSESTLPCVIITRELEDFADACIVLNFYRGTLMAPCFVFVVTMLRVYFTSTLLVFVWYCT